MFCTRTHSQISQFVQELRKTVYGKKGEKALKIVPICSRTSYCINEKVNKCKTAGKMNEKCQEYLDKNRCKLVGSHLVELRNTLMDSPLDIEEICKAGRVGLHCPYIATLQCKDEADIIAVPYQCVLHRATREAIGISMKSTR